MRSNAVRIYRVCLVVVACVAAGVIAGCGGSGGSGTGSGSSPSGEPIKIGMISTDHFKPQEIDSEDAPETAKGWEAYVNSHGGINGHPVSVTEIDDKGNPASGLQALEKFKNEGVVAIANNSVNDHVDDQALPKIAAAAHLPMIGMNGDWSGKSYESDPNYFATGSTESNEIWMFVKAGALAGIKKWGIMCRGPAYTCKQFAHLFGEEGKTVGLEMVYPGTVPVSATDVTSECREAKSAGAEALMAASPNSGEDANLIVKDCASIGYHPKMIMNATTIRPQGSPEKDLVATVNNQTVPYFVENSATAGFHEAMDSYLPTAASPYETMTDWVALEVIGEAAKVGVEEGGTPTSDDIYEGLYSFDENTIGGLAVPLTYAKGKPTPIHCGFFFELKNGSYSTPSGTAAICKD